MIGKPTTRETIATLLTGFGVIVAVWAIVRREVDGVRRDLTAQIAAVNNRIDNILLAGRSQRPR